MTEHITRGSVGDRLPHRGRRRSQAGMSLLEVMIAMVVLAIGIIGVTAGQILAMKNSSSSRQQSVAMNLAEEQMEIFRVMSAGDVLGLVADPGYPNDPANPLRPETGSGTISEFNRSWTIAADSPQADVMTITISVAWTDAIGATRTTVLLGTKADL